MKYFLDTEFLEGPQNQYFFGFKTPIVGPNTIDLISIGIVAEDGREYYSISKDFNLKEAWNRFDWKEHKSIHKEDEGKKLVKKVYWIRENVLKPIFYELSGKDISFHDLSTSFTYKQMKYLINKYGKTNKDIASGIRNFIYLENKDFGGQFVLGNFIPNKYPNPEFWADYCSYDWVVFCWLFGKMIDLPNGFPMYCNDIQQLFQYKCDLINKEAGIVISGAPKVTKKSFKENNPNYPIQDNSKKHHALEDARHDRDLYNFLNKL